MSTLVTTLLLLLKKNDQTTQFGPVASRPLLPGDSHLGKEGPTLAAPIKDKRDRADG